MFEYNSSFWMVFGLVILLMLSSACNRIKKNKYRDSKIIYSAEDMHEYSKKRYKK